jgi:hypothetical protein
MARYAPAIEFALVKLRYRYGASMDDILLDPALGEQFEALARAAAPELSSRQLRLGALCIRQARHFGRKEMAKATALDVSALEGAMKGPVSLADVRPESAPAGPGIVEVREPGRSLYISGTDALGATLEELRTGRPFGVMASGFWKPRLEAIAVRFAPDAELGGAEAGLWARRLIQEREPVFNWPVPMVGARQ